MTQTSINSKSLFFYTFNYNILCYTLQLFQVTTFQRTTLRAKKHRWFGVFYLVAGRKRKFIVRLDIFSRYREWYFRSKRSYRWRAGRKACSSVESSYVQASKSSKQPSENGRGRAVTQPAGHLRSRQCPGLRCRDSSDSLSPNFSYLSPPNKFYVRRSDNRHYKHPSVEI